MLDHILGKTTFGMLSRRLDQDSIRHKVIAGNIANVNTRGFQAKEVEFEEVLESKVKQVEMQHTQPEHFASRQRRSGKIINVDDQVIKNGINNVDVDEQMVAMAKNQLDFDLAATRLSRLFQSLKFSIRGQK
jgi:flagellar basal-body rod protein FlgB